MARPELSASTMLLERLLSHKVCIVKESEGLVEKGLTKFEMLKVIKAPADNAEAVNEVIKIDLLVPI